MKKIILVAFIAMALACCSTQKTIQNQNITQYKEDKTAVLVDVRTPEEYNEGHLYNSLNIDVKSDDFSEKIQQLDKNSKVYVYCRSGKRSAKAAEKMKELGFKHIVNLEGGFIEWEEAHLPIEK